MRLTIDQPAAWLNSNDRQHFHPRNQAFQAWKAATKLQADNHPSTPYGITHVHITATIHKARRGRWDAHNLMPTVKACIDGLVAAGVLIDDSNEHVHAVTIRAGEVGSPCLVLEVTPA